VCSSDLGEEDHVLELAQPMYGAYNLDRGDFLSRESEDDWICNR